MVAVQDVRPTLEPGMDFSNVGWRVFANMYDTLIGYDFAHDFAPVPARAESWRRIDGRTLELQLRAAAMWPGSRCRWNGWISGLGISPSADPRAFATEAAGE